MSSRPGVRAEIPVRRVTGDDWGAYREVRLRALATDPWAFGSTLGREEAFTEAQWRERIERDTPGSPGRTWAGVGPENRFVGTIAAARPDGEFHLFAMWVAPEQRRQGLGGRLVDAALAWIDSVEPGTSVRLDVNPRGTAAVQLYLSRGFRATGATEPLGHTPSETIEAMVRPGSSSAAGKASPPR